MPRHRFFEQFEVDSLPRGQTATVAVGAFCACPMALLSAMGGSPAAWQMSIYQRAFEQAQAVVRPSIIERDLLANWN